MPNFATCTLIGHLGRDPVTRPTSGEGSLTTFSLGVTRSGKDATGAKVELTTWWRCMIWGTRGKTAAQHLRKGSCVIVTGWPQSRPFTDEHGAKSSINEVLNADWAFGESRATAQNAQSAEPVPATPAAAPRPAAGADDEPPF